MQKMDVERPDRLHPWNGLPTTAAGAKYGGSLGSDQVDVLDDNAPIYAVKRVADLITEAKSRLTGEEQSAS
ncbi:MAG: hypothetical protein E5W94_05390 [Mesorhizobium sp.]|nr:MAG: hypothetical protein E5W94_05390 [Mesorhizobium sp.]